MRRRQLVRFSIALAAEIVCAAALNFFDDWTLESMPVKFVACARDDAMEAGDDEVNLLLEEGWRPEDVALLTTGTRHPEQKERHAAGHAAYWDSFWDADQVFYGHVLGFKGLERRGAAMEQFGDIAFQGGDQPLGHGDQSS